MQQLRAHPVDLSIFVVARGMEVMNQADDDPRAQGHSLARMMERILGKHGNIVDTPQSTYDPPACLSSNINNVWNCATPRNRAFNWRYLKLERTAAADSGATLIDLTDDICPRSVPCRPACGMIVYRDVHHLTETPALSPMIAWSGRRRTSSATAAEHVRSFRTGAGSTTWVWGSGRSRTYRGGDAIPRPARHRSRPAPRRGAELRSAGYEMATPLSGANAPAHRADEKPDLLLVDSMAGGNNGCAFVEEMRRTETGPARVPVLVLGESLDVAAKISAFRAGADDYLSKPPSTRPSLLGRASGLVARLHPGENTGFLAGGKVIAWYGAKGGVGTTTLAINSAIALHRDMDPSVVLVDAALQP